MYEDEVLIPGEQRHEHSGKTLKAGHNANSNGVLLMIFFSLVTINTQLHNINYDQPFPSLPAYQMTYILNIFPSL